MLVDICGLLDAEEVFLVMNFEQLLLNRTQLNHLLTEWNLADYAA